MSGPSRASSARRGVIVTALLAAGCQSILGIDSDRPLVTSEPASADAGKPPADDASPPRLDASTPDVSVVDAGGADAGDTNVTPDAAPEASAPDTGTDSAPPVSFTNPVQIDVSALLNVNSVVTTTVGGMALTAMDGSGTGDGNDFPTVSFITTLSSTGRGLPDNAFFASNGTSIPDVQLAWKNTQNAANSVVVSSTAGTTFTFDVPVAQYSQLQLYATGGGGASTLNYSLTYADATTVPSSLSVPDWCLGTAASGQYILVSVDRVENGTTLNAAYLCNIYALDLNPDTGKALKSVTFWDTGGGTTYLVFYGATAW